MKVVHIGSNTTGGAGLGMMGVHNALLSAGVESTVVTMKVVPGEENDPNIEIVAPEEGFVDPIGTVVDGIRKKHRGVPVSSPYSGVRVEDLACIREADIIHLHWISGIVDWERFFRKVNKPIVWTIRDENVMMGLYHIDCDRPINPTDDERRVDIGLKDKKAAWINACRDLTFVSLSTGMKERVDMSEIGEESPLSYPIGLIRMCFS